MSTILDELTKYRTILNESDREPLKIPKKKMGAAAYRKYLHDHPEVGVTSSEKKKDVKESDNHDIENGIMQGMKRAKKLKNATMLYYYLEASKKQLRGFVPYEDFINSWAGGFWFDRNLKQIKELVNRENQLNFNGTKWFVDGLRDSVQESIVNEFNAVPSMPNWRDDQQAFNLGKKGAIDQLSDVIDNVPDDRSVSYEEFGRGLVKMRQEFDKHSDAKAKDFCRGWNDVLRMVNEICPKRREQPLSKPELEALVLFVGQKELNWH